MEAVIDFYIHELKNNPDLSRDDREKYLDFINAYTFGNVEAYVILNKTWFDVCQTKFKKNVHSWFQVAPQLSLQKHHQVQNLFHILGRFQF